MTIFKKQGVAWVITAVMIAAAIAIGLAKAAAGGPGPGAASQSNPPAGSQSAMPDAAAMYIFDDAGVLSAASERELADRNRRLLDRYDVTISVVTCNYGRDDLYDYALERALEMDLRDRDMLVVLDIKGKEYGMIQGIELVNDFTDDDCYSYAHEYMGQHFAAGDYDSAVLDLTEMLEAWYGTYFG